MKKLTTHVRGISPDAFDRPGTKLRELMSLLTDLYLAYVLSSEIKAEPPDDETVGIQRFKYPCFREHQEMVKAFERATRVECHFVQSRGSIRVEIGFFNTRIAHYRIKGFVRPEVSSPDTADGWYRQISVGAEERLPLAP